MSMIAVIDWFMTCACTLIWLQTIDGHDKNIKGFGVVTVMSIIVTVWWGVYVGFVVAGKGMGLEVWWSGMWGLYIVVMVGLETYHFSKALPIAFGSTAVLSGLPYVFFLSLRTGDFHPFLKCT